MKKRIFKDCIPVIDESKGNIEEQIRLLMKALKTAVEKEEKKKIK
jgi:hypothetical protein